MHAAAGTVVEAVGAVVDALHVVGHGRLAAAGADGCSGTGPEIGPGEVVGATGLLADAVAVAEVRAVRDSLLLRLTASSFQRFGRRHPEALLGLCRTLVRLGARADRGAGQRAAAVRGRTVAVLAAGSGAPGAVPDDVIADLVDALATLGPTARLSPSQVDAELGAGSADLELADPRNGRLVGWLHRVEQQHRFVVYQADGQDTEWSRRCLRQADQVLLVAVAGTDPPPGPVERALRGAGHPARCDLVLLHPPAAPAPSGTASWLAGRAVTGHHHVRRGHVPDFRRVARHLGGVARGLVLGGGGMRGFAHLGVMQALEEAGVEIDAVGGTSIGSIMGALFAAGLPHEERVRAAVNAMVGQGSLVRPTLPFVSLSSAAKVSRLLRTEPAFTGEIEDLWVPFFCVSASLTAACEVIHDRGTVWRAIRSSISLPGVYPPVPGGEQLLVDGAVLNNLPVDVMTGLVGSGPVVAVDLDRRGELAPEDAYDVSLSGWRVLAARLRPGPGMRVPRATDVVFRSLSLASIRAQRERLAARPVALHLQPPLGDGGLLDFRAGPALIEPAFRYTLAALERAPVLG